MSSNVDVYCYITYLTYDRDYTDDEVVDIPGTPEVMPTQTYDLDSGLQQEDGCEDNIHHVQGIAVCIRLLVMFHRHGYHVQEDKHHNGQFKLHTHRHIKKEGLEHVLKQICVKKRHYYQ